MFCLLAGAAFGAEAGAPIAIGQEQALTAPGPQGPLGGLFLSAGKNAPVVLLVPGSGPTDRDGNSALGFHPATLRLIAEGLAVHGISSLRIDKRGLFSSARAIPDANAVTISDYVSDVQTWMTVIHDRTGVTCIWLAGHSEGGLIALAAARMAHPLCGLILLSTPGRRIDTILHDQIAANPANVLLMSRIEGILAAIRQGRPVDDRTLPSALKSLFRSQVQNFLIDEDRYDPAVLLAAYRGPVLILQGGLDRQVSPTDDFFRLRNAAPGGSAILLPAATHVLKDATDKSREAGWKTYLQSGLPLDPGVVTNIAEFVLAH
ncbi:putative hydrolase [Gluconobacter morbifer G707]|uniref:Putative hydrolase n=2 Tax=Gluconobacter TaxID=441 RepID=G6XMU8_9PROT|nr:putative hydrolase [Gluconobacter morbifer G707]